MKQNSDFATRLDAVVAGEADAAEIKALHDLAKQGVALARKLALAMETRDALRRLARIQAPDLLRTRLRRLPAPSRRMWAHPWGLGIAAGLLLAAFTGLLNRGPSRQEVLQTRQELAVAFGYLEKTREQVAVQTRQRISHSMEQPLELGLSRASIFQVRRF